MREPFPLVFHGTAGFNLTHQIVAIALVVAKEEVFAMLGAIGVPILARYLDSGSLGVLVPSVVDIVLVEPVEYFLSSFHSTKIIIKVATTIARLTILC